MPSDQPSVKRVVFEDIKDLLELATARVRIPTGEGHIFVCPGHHSPILRMVRWAVHEQEWRPAACLGLPDGKEAKVIYLAFNPSGRSVLGGTEDGRLICWRPDASRIMSPDYTCAPAWSRLLRTAKVRGHILFLSNRVAMVFSQELEHRPHRGEMACMWQLVDVRTGADLEPAPAGSRQTGYINTSLLSAHMVEDRQGDMAVMIEPSHTADALMLQQHRVIVK